MNTQTTTAPRIAIDSTGIKFQLPENFPLVNQRLWLRKMACDMNNLDNAILDIANNMDDVLFNGGQISQEELGTIWQDAELAFIDAKGRTWEEEINLDEYNEHMKNLKIIGQEGRNEEKTEQIQTIYGLTEQEIEQIDTHLIHNTFEPRPGDIYGSVKFGACSSRRAGIQPKTWVARMMERTTSWRNRDDVADYYSFILYMVRMAYTMPISELVR